MKGNGKEESMVGTVAFFLNRELFYFDQFFFFWGGGENFGIVYINR